jgi:transcriptional regulator with XRE-family HTH domain
LAEIFKVDPTTLLKIERGGREISRKVKMKLANLLLDEK